MYPNFIPNGAMFNGIPYGMGNTIGNIGRIGATARGTGILSRLGFTGKSINWGGLLNNASKTLGVINQAIPLVKQAGPMFNNMKSMMRLASIFKDETDNSPRRNYNNQNNMQNFVNQSDNNQYQQNNQNNYDDNLVEQYQYNNSPNFFI